MIDLFEQINSNLFNDSEHLRKVNIIDDDDMDTIEYDDIRTYIFRPDLSNGLTGDEIVTVLHPGKSPNAADQRNKLNQFILKYL